MALTEEQGRKIRLKVLRLDLEQNVRFRDKIIERIKKIKSEMKKLED